MNTVSFILQTAIDLSALIAALLFIFGLKRMSSPATALKGIVLAGIGMLIAIIASFGYLDTLSVQARPHLLTNCALALIALVIGTGWAWYSGSRVAVTAMPQMVALYNGMGGGAAAALAAVALLEVNQSYDMLDRSLTLVGALIGAISLSGSVIAWAKLDGRINKALRWQGQSFFNATLFLLAVALGGYLAFATPASGGFSLILTFFIGALAFGILMTLPIGGADMPVVISLYNAFTGLAVGLEGYALQNPALMIAGMVVGSAGTLLTLLMAKAMNRSLRNVLFSNFGDGATTSQQDIQGRLKPVEASDAGVTMRYAASVIIVPGYGMAVAQAQSKLAELLKMLQAAGVDVKFAIHPVAGRMPGHMNVLLAEAGIPYDIIYDMVDINESFSATDIALVIGANDVVNPAARTDTASPIYGMPILDVDHAHQVYVIKRGQGKGYAGVENLLFYGDNCNMIYGDAQVILGHMIQAIKEIDSTSASVAKAA
jgi:H+-translocating NAD(P) transhydrogenase subunit beta